MNVQFWLSDLKTGFFDATLGAFTIMYISREKKIKKSVLKIKLKQGEKKMRSK